MMKHWKGVRFSSDCIVTLAFLSMSPSFYRAAICEPGRPYSCGNKIAAATCIDVCTTSIGLKIAGFVISLYLLGRFADFCVRAWWANKNRDGAFLAIGAIVLTIFILFMMPM
jgi:hypothetical protein